MTDKILLVTGASSDVGLALLHKVAADYDALLCHYGRSSARIDRLREELGDKVVPLQADFSDEGGSRLADEIIDRNLAPSHWVHLPAIPNVNEKFTKTKWSDFESQINVQLRSAWELAQAFMPLMAKRKFGRAVFMATGNIVHTPPPKKSLPYTTAKFAVAGFARLLAAEYSDRGITVNCVSPDFFESQFNSMLPELVLEVNANAFPMKRNLTLDDIVPMFEFLLSDGAGMITGQNIAITGGRG